MACCDGCGRALPDGRLPRIAYFISEGGQFGAYCSDRCCLATLRRLEGSAAGVTVEGPVRGPWLPWVCAACGVPILAAEREA